MNDSSIFLTTLFLLAGAVLLLAAAFVSYSKRKEIKEVGDWQGWWSVLKESFSWHLDPHKPLHEHWLFWLVVLIPVLLGIALGLPIWQAYSFSLSESGYETFLKISKLPFYVMAPAIPLGMVVAAFHKTKQTAEQIRQTKSNNSFRNYIDHRKMFVDLSKERLSQSSADKAYDWYDFMFSESMGEGILEISLKNKFFNYFEFDVALFSLGFNYRDILGSELSGFYDSFDHRLNEIKWVVFEEGFINFLKVHKSLFDSVAHQGMAEKLNEFFDFYGIACALNISNTNAKNPPFIGLRFINVKKENGFTREMLDELLLGSGYVSKENVKNIEADFKSKEGINSFQNSGLYLVSKQLYDRLKGMQDTDV
ncbi:hypothetical protein [Marinospirillum sp.]|uniref:hypothetical protein n=1 Tax=Marinospirillum sp. TaxID=2183934 RepID=UPI003851634E